MWISNTGYLKCEALINDIGCSAIAGSHFNRSSRLIRMHCTDTSSFYIDLSHLQLLSTSTFKHM